jgi:hypothetical protein
MVMSKNNAKSRGIVQVPQSGLDALRRFIPGALRCQAEC